MKKYLLGGLAVAAGLWLLRQALPLTVPFLLGLLAALAAEPGVRVLSRKLPRGAASGIGVTAVLLLIVGLLLLIAALAVRELGKLAGALPQLGQNALQGISSLRDRLTGIADQAPEGLQPVLLQATQNLFSSGSAMIEALAAKLPGVASAVLGWVPDSALTAGTAVLSAYLFSVRLPRMGAWLREHSPLFSKGVDTLKKLRQALWGWLKAQAKLSGVCFVTVTAGLLLLRVPRAPLWALLIAVVDALPVLGSGTVLLPWAAVCLLQGRSAMALGLGGLYAVTLLCRSLLEPRLVGKQLGLDPLVTLLCLYVGFRLWGLWGVLASPVLSVGLREGAALLNNSR